jgi:hypothetical protein
MENLPQNRGGLRVNLKLRSFLGAYLLRAGNSDVGMLVEFDPEFGPSLLGKAGMEIELSEMLGRKVDLRTARDLTRYFRDGRAT